MKRPVCSFWWTDVMSLTDTFFIIASCKVNKGNSVCFWTDLWDFGQLQLGFPQLFSFVTDKRASVQKFLSQDVYTNFFTPLYLGLTVHAASNPVAELVTLIQGLTVEMSMEDQWSYI